MSFRNRPEGVSDSGTKCPNMVCQVWVESDQTCTSGNGYVSEQLNACFDKIGLSLLFSSDYSTSCCLLNLALQYQFFGRSGLLQVSKLCSALRQVSPLHLKKVEWGHGRDKFELCFVRFLSKFRSTCTQETVWNERFTLVGLKIFYFHNVNVNVRHLHRGE